MGDDGIPKDVDGDVLLDDGTSTQAPAEKDESSEPVVNLSRAQYDALLDHLSELEAMALSNRGGPKSDDLDDLIDEGRQQPPMRQQPPQQQRDFSEMSAGELYQAIMQDVSQIGQGVLERVEELSVLREIDKAEATHDDFWDYHKEIKGLVTSNPNLSIEDAYLLVKQKVGPKGSEGGEPRRTKAERLFQLPPKTFGERPTSVSGATKESRNMSLKEATLEAMAELKAKGGTLK